MYNAPEDVKASNIGIDLLTIGSGSINLAPMVNLIKRSGMFIFVKIFVQEFY